MVALAQAPGLIAEGAATPSLERARQCQTNAFTLMPRLVLGFALLAVICVFLLGGFLSPSVSFAQTAAELGATPEPTTLLLWGTTMAGLGLAARWRRSSQG
jgi:hypothetical protein